MKNPNALAGLAGEYAVAARMALHGWHASPTIKTFPKVDLVAYNPETGKRLTVQVKTGRRGAWNVGVIERDGGLWQIRQLDEPADVYVLVEVSDDPEPVFSFYIVPTSKLKEILLQHAEAKYGKRRTVEPQPCWVNMNKQDHRDEWKVIVQYKDRWELLDEAAR
jgi:hypothetical protein